MKTKNAFNTVTTFSKTLALIMFIAFPFLGFYLGMQYQKGLDKPFIQSVLTPKRMDKACTLDAKICADGSSVGRTGPNCEFANCPEDN